VSTNIAIAEKSTSIWGLVCNTKTCYAYISRHSAHRVAKRLSRKWGLFSYPTLWSASGVNRLAANTQTHAMGAK